MRAQIAMEYLFVVGFAMLLLLPLIYVFYSQTASMSDEVITAQAKRVADEITAAADEVYYLGPPSKQTIKLNFPKNIVSTSISGTGISLVVDTTSGLSEVTSYSDANLTGDLGTFEGIHRIVIEAGENNVSITEER